MAATDRTRCCSGERSSTSALQTFSLQAMEATLCAELPGSSGTVELPSAMLSGSGLLRTLSMYHYNPRQEVQRWGDREE
jgi:hypothetical protein